MSRRGFTLMEMLVVLVVILALAAIVIPQVAGRARDATPTAVISSISTLADAIGQFKADVRRYPGRLEWLGTNTGSPTDICGNAIPAGLLDRWNGPYIQRQVSNGIPAGDATVINLLERDDPASTTVSSLILKAADIGQEAAETIDREIDGTIDLNAGTVRWTDVAGPTDTLYYYYPIRGC
ncbi:MAG: prepilin-type N-terminal cleavage/methylation domain-containing protein [Longimicrobiales bacterium]